MIASKTYGLGCASLLNKFILISVTWVTLLQRLPFGMEEPVTCCSFLSLILTYKIERLAVLHALHFKISVNSSENLEKHLNVWYVPAKTAVVVELETTLHSTTGRGLY